MDVSKLYVLTRMLLTPPYTLPVITGRVERIPIKFAFAIMIDAPATPLTT